MTTSQQFSPQDLPLAAPGLISYRYKGTYGWIMIGALSHDDALAQARRSTSADTAIERLQVWCESSHAYKQAINADQA